MHGRQAAGEGRCGTEAPAPHQPSRPTGNGPPSPRLGKSRKIDFCFSTVCRVFIDQAAAGVSIRVTRRELDQELLCAQPGAFLGWVNLPVKDAWTGGWAGPGARGTGWGGAEGQERRTALQAGAEPWHSQGRIDANQYEWMTLPVTEVMEPGLEIGRSSLPRLQLIGLISHPGQLSPAWALVASSSV